MAQVRISFIDTVEGIATFPAGEYLSLSNVVVQSHRAPPAEGVLSVEIIPDVSCRVAIGSKSTLDPNDTNTIFLRPGQRLISEIAPGQIVTAIRHNNCA